jgi:hypothetical protein
MTTPADVTAGYRDRLLRQRLVAGVAVTAGLREIDLDLTPDRLRAEMLRWAAAAAALTMQGQESAARLSSAYLAGWLSAAGAREPLPALDLQLRVGTVPGDVPGGSLEEAMRRSAFSVLWRLRTAPSDQALKYGGYAANRVTWTALQDNATGVLADGIDAHPQIIGWRRITSSNACQRCVLAAHRQYRSTEPLRRRHPSCRCTQEAVLSRT